jgi:electron transfer flavoprotein beta subunit
MVNIIVCIKQVVDPEAPPSNYKVDASANKIIPPPGVPVVDPYGEFAVEAALKVKDAVEGKIIALSLGSGFRFDVVKKPLAMGADDLVLLDDEAFEGGDSWTTAKSLAMAINKIGAYDLILCGREASDWNAGQVGSGLAEMLGIPCVSLAKKVEITNGLAVVERITDYGYEVIEVVLPAVITVSSEIGTPRYPSIKGVMTAKKIKPTVWKPVDIGLDSSQVGNEGRKEKLIELFQPFREGEAEIIQGETPEEAGENLVLRLREEKIL